MLRIIFIITAFSLLLPLAEAKGVFQQPSEFISESFAGQPPEPQIIWLSKAMRKQIEEILQHKYRGLRIRYYLKDGRSVWVLDETGKEKPITTGFVINNSKIEQVKVLVFRESRGWEVRYPFFTKQFIDSTITEKNELSKPIDGISGATLSVRALTKLARVALLLNQHITKQK